MVAKITDAQCVSFIRNSKYSNTETVERILCRKMGIEPRKFIVQKRGNEKIADLKTNIPVKIIDPRIVRYIDKQKKAKGIPQKRTVEHAILDFIKKSIEL